MNGKALVTEISPLTLCSGVFVCVYLVCVSVCAQHFWICCGYCNAIMYFWSTELSFFHIAAEIIESFNCKGNVWTQGCLSCYLPVDRGYR